MTLQSSCLSSFFISGVIPGLEASLPQAVFDKGCWNIDSYILLGRQHVVLAHQAFGCICGMYTITILLKESLNTSYSVIKFWPSESVNTVVLI